MLYVRGKDRRCNEGERNGGSCGRIVRLGGVTLSVVRF